VLAAGRRAALSWATLLDASAVLDLYQVPELDIVCYFPSGVQRTTSAIDAASAAMLQAGLTDPERPVFVSTLRVTADALGSRHAGIAADSDAARILRSVLMKPEHEAFVPALHERLEQLAQSVSRPSR
jgi:hypothetical protein